MQNLSGGTRFKCYPGPFSSVSYTRKADPFQALAEKYAKAYPDCKAFHITSDRQVFLDKDKNLAQYHQKGLGEGEVRTINVR